MEFVFHNMENIVEKRQIAGYKRYLLFPQYLQQPIFCRPFEATGCLGKGQLVSVPNPLFFYSIPGVLT